MGFFDYIDDLTSKISISGTPISKKLADAPAVGGYLSLPGIVSGGASAVKNAVWRNVPAGTSGITYTGAALVGLGGIAGGYLLGGSKKTEAIPQATDQKQTASQAQAPNVYHAPYEVYEPKYDIRTSNQYDYSTSIISNSPYASLTKKTTADISGSTPASWNTPNTYAAPQSTGQSQESAQSQKSGMDWTTITAIAGVALVAYGMTGRGKHGK